MGTIIRRRAGASDVRRDESGAVVHLLESGELRPMAQRLAGASVVLRAALEKGQWLIPTVGIEEREPQRAFLWGFLKYLDHALDGLAHDPEQPTVRARNVAAARTGKTIEMILVVVGAGLRCVVLAPSKAIVDKTVAEIKTKAPTIPVGAYYGAEKEMVSNGVTVATYQTVARHAANGTLPKSIHEAALVFCDEAHESMSEYRQAALAAFDAQALVVAFTATPDYNRSDKMLVHFYPYLIRQLRLADAYGKGMLAKALMRWRPVDLDATQVKLVTREGPEGVEEDFDPKAMGKLMGRTEVFQEVLYSRYHLESERPKQDPEEPTVKIPHRDLKAMITCPRVTVAERLREFLEKHQPAGTPVPKLVIGATSDEERRQILKEFKEGTNGTIIVVGSLLTGFDEPTLCLLIDISPGCSLVRAEQKFCRPLTKLLEKIGIIVLVYPSRLRRAPVLPTDILGPGVGGDDPDRVREQILSVKPISAKPTIVPPVSTKPKLKRRASIWTRALDIILRPPTFNPQNMQAVRAVLFTSPELMDRLAADERVGRREFKELLFDHPTFGGTGKVLLKYCKVRPGWTAFRNWFDYHLREFGHMDIEPWEWEALPEEADRISWPADLIVPPEQVEHEVEIRRIIERFFPEAGGGSEIPERQRLVFQMWLEGYTNDEIGRQIDRVGETARKDRREVIDRIRQLLRIMVVEYGEDL